MAGEALGGRRSCALPRSGGGRVAAAPPKPLGCRAYRLALQRGLELAAGRELGHGRGCDLDALARARVHSLARSALGGGELAEAGEVDRLAALQRLGDAFHEGVDGLAGVAVRETALL